MSWTLIMLLIAVYLSIEYMLPHFRKTRKERILDRRMNDSQERISATEQSLLFSIKNVTAREAAKSAYHMRNNPNVISREILLPKGMGFEDGVEYIDGMEEFEPLELKKYINDVRSQLLDSRMSSITKQPMIPLCVSYKEKDEAKQIGAQWCPQMKTWYWSYSKDRSSVGKWLPKLYKETNNSPVIQPRMVPAPLWKMNLRLFLNHDQLKRIWRTTQENFGHRCCVCGCRGSQWPVECDEIWSYETDRDQGTGIFKLEGLQSLCPPCHRVIHFGKAVVDKKDLEALAQLIVLNNLVYDDAVSIVNKSFEVWSTLSDINQWRLNSDFLEQEYGIVIENNEYLTKVA